MFKFLMTLFNEHKENKLKFFNMKNKPLHISSISYASKKWQRAYHNDKLIKKNLRKWQFKNEQGNIISGYWLPKRECWICDLGKDANVSSLCIALNDECLFSQFKYARPFLWQFVENNKILTQKQYEELKVVYESNNDLDTFKTLFKAYF